MDKLSELSLITTYLNKKDDALELMRSLLKNKVAGVINIFETCSYFGEHASVAEMQEWKMVAKTLPALAEQVFKYIKSSHPSKTPYIVMQKAQTNSEYVDWLREQLRGANL